jgi:regulator of PEP synthase PpsR (kinase-PPPase family)
MTQRTVFFVSDGTGITAETFGNSILSQFSAKPRHVRRPFIDTPDKAHQVVREIDHAAATEGKRPIVFVTLVDPEILQILKGHSKGLVLDMFNTFIEPLEAEFGITSNASAASRMSPRARNTRTGSRPSTSRSPTTTVSRRRT